MRLVTIIVVGVVILSYFHVDLRNLFSSDSLSQNVNSIWSFIQHVWYDYIKTPIIFALHWLLSLIQ